MKKHVFTFMAFFVICMSFIMVSCSDDENDKDKEAREEMLIGKWVMTYCFYEDEDEEEDRDYDISEEYDVIILREDGVCRNYCKSFDNISYDWNDYGEWAVMNDNKLKLLFYGEGENIVTINRLTETTLSFELNGIDEDDGMPYTYKITYKKVD